MDRGKAGGFRRFLSGGCGLMAREKNGAYKTSKINPDSEDRLNGDSFQLARHALHANADEVTPGDTPTGAVTSAISLTGGAYTQNFDTGAPAYSWLNESLFVAEGRIHGTNEVEYAVYQVL